MYLACTEILDGICRQYIQIDVVQSAGAEPISGSVTSLTGSDLALSFTAGFFAIFFLGATAFVIKSIADVMRSGTED